MGRPNTERYFQNPRYFDYLGNEVDRKKSSFLIHNREGTKNLYAYFSVGGGIKRSMKTIHQSEAVRKAVKIYQELHNLSSLGKDLKERLFHTVCDFWLPNARNTFERNTVERYFKNPKNPLYHKSVKVIQAADINRWTEWRKEQIDPDSKKRPTDLSLHKQLAVLARIFKYAYGKGWIDHLPRIERPTLKLGKGDEFTAEELRILREGLDSWCRPESLAANTPVPALALRKRLLLRTWVKLSLAIGLRPSEPRNLKWEHYHTEKKGNRLRVRLMLQGKGKKRTIWVFQEVATILDEWKTCPLNKHTKPPDYIFNNNGEKFKGTVDTGFMNLLESIGINPKRQDGVKTRKGKVRNLYSLRHTLISDLLRKGVSDSWIAELCGTSTKQIRAHYGHLTHLEASERVVDFIENRL